MSAAPISFAASYDGWSEKPVHERTIGRPRNL
jgi:hypothetical protein